MDIVESLRKYQCPTNKGCNPLVEYCQSNIMDDSADEIERLREALRKIAHFSFRVYHAPNNRIFWKDSNWVTKKLPKNLKQFEVDEELPSVENQSDRWVTEDTDSFYYDIKNREETK